jgi:short-subunit dehydrogenase
MVKSIVLSSAMEIKGKVAIVTGASDGIGEATAKLLSKEGAKVALVARNADKLARLSTKLPESVFIVADMSNEDEIKKMVAEVFKRYGKIDILVNNAGQGYDASIEKTNIDTFRKIFALDVLGPMIAMKEVIPIMRKEKAGAIINISSGTALMALPNMAAYSSAKRALAQISLTAAEELKNDRITVGVVYPYITNTDFEKNTIKEEAGPEWHPEDDSDLKPPDAPSVVAKKILEGIKSGQTVIYAHSWMKNITG